MLFMLPAPALCQDAAPTDGTNPGFFAAWAQRVRETRAEQPHWITPLATVTPRLEQEFRFDIDWQTANSGITSENYDGGKGLELIPSRHIELLINLPPYLVHNNPNIADGFGDFSFMVKYRLLAANESVHGGYILTFFLGASVPTGSHSNGTPDAIVTPTVAYGKGFGHFDAQGTFGVGLPVADTNIIGRTYAWNNAFQYHVLKNLWPEIETNSGFFQQGKNDGKKQTFITPGLVVGGIHLTKAVGLTFGGGFQIAVTRFHTTNHNVIWSIRFPF